MKIVATDNFDRDYIPEHVVASDLSHYEAKKKCDELNSGYAGREWFYEVRPDDAKIRTREDIYSPGTP